MCHTLNFSFTQMDSMFSVGFFFSSLVLGHHPQGNSSNHHMRSSKQPFARVNTFNGICEHMMCLRSLILSVKNKKSHHRWPWVIRLLCGGKWGNKKTQWRERERGGGGGNLSVTSISGVKDYYAYPHGVLDQTRGLGANLRLAHLQDSPCHEKERTELCKYLL